MAISLIVCLINFHYALGQKKSDSISIDNKIIQYIKSDFLKLYGGRADSLNFIKANVKIELDMTSTAEDVTSKKYVPGFSFSNSDLKLKNKQLIEYVYDSLELESKRLNSVCNIGTQPVLKVLRSSQEVCVFFSNECHGRIYTEAVGSFGIIVKENGYDIYGQANCYLFEIENDRIVNVYRGEIDYN